MAYRGLQMDLGAVAGREMILHIGFLDEAHGGSNGSVACLNGARLERSLECRRREGKNGLSTPAYACRGSLAGGAPALQSCAKFQSSLFTIGRRAERRAAAVPRVDSRPDQSGKPGQVHCSAYKISDSSGRSM